MRFTALTTVLMASASLLVACESTSESQANERTEVYTPAPTRTPTTTTRPPATPEPQATPTPTSSSLSQIIGPFRSSGHAALDAWRDDFAQRAYGQGFHVTTIRSVLSGIEPMSIFLESRADIVHQSEFSKPIWEYLDSAVSSSRISNGREKLATDASLFADLERTYGVPGEYLTAIWGMETSYGQVKGDFDAPSALSSMATEGRRRAFAEGELLALMRILDRGDAKREWLQAGWAGAMGHTQFMPSTYYAYAVDWTGDGTIDVWNARADALASAANYLSKSGWRAGEPAVREVTLPPAFDYSLADGEERTIPIWGTLGLEPVGYTELAPGTVNKAELWLPAGKDGPAFLLFTNFRMIKTYNRADSYALAVSLLAENIAGRASPSAAWPRDIDRLSIEEVKVLQNQLNQLGYNAGVVDGIAGRGTRKALQNFQADRRMMADGYPTQRALNAVLNGR
ncbi:lytic murein transglycosylase [Ponticaulis profundi]|uniref:Lytic murein transglycosylase n=1 Tax=Ponticaulis profundi TaxID=2665222 RepID=A0ABW1S9D9_9PROT